MVLEAIDSKYPLINLDFPEDPWANFDSFFDPFNDIEFLHTFSPQIPEDIETIQQIREETFKLWEIENTPPSIEFEAQKGIGEYVEGCSWKDQVLWKKCLDVFIAIIKMPFLLPLAISSYFRLNQIDQNPPIHQLQESTPELGKWSPNYTFLTEDPQESMEMKKRLIDSAEHSIEISGSYCGGKVFNEVLDAIEEKLQNSSELEVKILSNQDFLTETNYSRIKHLAETYPDQFFLVETDYQFFSLPTLRTMENHTKFLIIDGIRCMTGGTGIFDAVTGNINEANDNKFEERLLGKYTRDMDAVIEGPLAETMRHQFHQLLSKWSRITPEERKYGNTNCKYAHIPEETKKQLSQKDCGLYAGKDPTRRILANATLIIGSYEHGSANGCKLAYLKMIREAKNTITIANMCFNQPEILEEVKQAAIRGVKVKVITNSDLENSSFTAKSLGVVSISRFFPLAEQGVEFHQYAEDSTLLHKKFMVVDDQLTTIGSCNISLHSMDTQDENIVIIDSNEVAEKANDVLQKDLENSIKLNFDQISIFRRFYYHIASWFMLLFTAHLKQ